MAMGAKGEPFPELLRLFRPLNTETWFRVGPKNRCSANNKYVDAVRCDILFAYPATDGIVHWNINGRRVTPRQLIKIETARSQRQKVRISGMLIEPAEVKSEGHIVVREFLSVHDEPKLEVRRCLTTSTETVKLVAVGLREPVRMDYGPEVIIQPVDEHQLRLTRLRSPLVVVVKTEPPDPDENQDPQTTQKVGKTPIQGTFEKSTPPRKKPRKERPAGGELPTRMKYSLRRRNPP